MTCERLRGLADLVRRKAVSPEDLLDAAIERVEVRNQAVNAVVMLVGAEALLGCPRPGAFQPATFFYNVKEFDLAKARSAAATTDESARALILADALSRDRTTAALPTLE